MNSMAFIFPGQGSQTVGMGKFIHEKSEEVRRLFARASEILGIDLVRLCFEGPVEELNLTVNAQPALLTVNHASELYLKSKGIIPKIVAGHSLGEYNALVAAKVLAFTDALELVRKRAQFMQEAVPDGKGAMAAIIGLEPAHLLKLCKRVASREGDVTPVNFNCPGQIVIAGFKEYVREVIAKAKEEGAKMAKELAVSIPSHCRLMKPAAEKLAKEMEKFSLSDPQIPVVTNYDAKIKHDGVSAGKALIKQIATPVLWEESMKTMVNTGVKNYVEVGPGKVLSGLLRRIDRSVSCWSMEKMDENTLLKIVGAQCAC